MLLYIITQRTTSLEGSSPTSPFSQILSVHHCALNGGLVSTLLWNCFSNPSIWTSARRVGGGGGFITGGGLTAAGDWKVSAASARAHNRKQQQSSLSLPSCGMFMKILLVSLVGIVAWFYQAIQPPPPKICGSPNGPPITSPRIQLKDGRYLAYRENGIPKEKANYKIISIHGFQSCRHDVLPLSQDVVEELGVYMVTFDRAGYGESDPNPRRTEEGTCLDVEELADQLDLGSKFYVVGYSMGGQAVWGCLKYIPHRLAGAVLLTPVANYWWPSFPANVSKQAFYKQLSADRWAVAVAHYLPWLTYWWNTQKWFPPSNVIADDPAILSPADELLFPKFVTREPYEHQILQQGEHESLHRDMIVGFGTWRFDPMELDNPFPGNEGSVHLWQGDDDWLVPVELQRYISSKLPWVHYHELKGSGHMFPLADGMFDTIVKSLVLGEGEQH